jgi:hypothetical protein
MVKAADASAKPRKKPKPKPKLTDEERHARFVDMAREVEAEETKASFDIAFSRVVTPLQSSKKDDS